MRNLIIFAFIVFGGWYWHNSRQEVLVDENGTPVVVIYTAKQCGAPCQTALNILDSRRVPYQNKELDLDDETSEDVKRWRSISGNMLPFTVAGHVKVNSSSKWELIGLLGENYGDTYLTAEEQKYFSQHFDDKGNPRVALYGTSWCGYCAALRKELNEHGIDLVDIDVEKSGEFDQLTRVMEIPGYPAVWVGYNRVQGSNFRAVETTINQQARMSLL